MGKCKLCPRQCGADRRAGDVGFCGQTDRIRIARAALHLWEEPSIAGNRGAGAVFFSGCNLRCVYCQNHQVSHENLGYEVSEEELYRIFLSLQDQGASCLDLVTPTHYAGILGELLRKVRGELKIPVVYNCGGYESSETVRMLSDVVDVWMPDFKYVSPELSARYSFAPDYGERAAEALRAMYLAAGDPVFRPDGILQKGVIVRHLVLPGSRKDSIAVLRRIAETVPVKGVLLSLMSQYTPEFAKNCAFSELHRRVTSFEYQSVLEEAQRLGFEGYFQRRSSANAQYTPDFSGIRPPSLGTNGENGNCP